MKCLTPSGSPPSARSVASSRGGGTEKQLYRSEDDAFPTHYVSSPPPPPELWDSDDARFLERVRCHAILRVTGIDPQLSTYKVRMKCHWAFRTLNSQEGAELRWRGIPGIRMPGLLVGVEESRIWKDLTRKSDGKMRTTATSVFWRGTSTFAISGFKTFQMKDFPYDRQVINLERLEFVWRPSNWPEKDSQDDYYKRMQVVKFTVKTSSMLPEWEAYDALIDVRESALALANNSSAALPDAITAGVSLEQRSGNASPTFATSFTLKLRIERKHWFYVRQVFFVTYLITLVSCTPLCMPPEERHMGDRLSLYGGGLLTLVAFKYGISEHLPSVPYATFTDDFLLHQILTITVCCFETLLAYRLPAENTSFWVTWDEIENYIFLVLCILWTIYLVHAAFVKPAQRRRWTEVVKEIPDEEFELDDPDAEDLGPRRRA